MLEDARAVAEALRDALPPDERPVRQHLLRPAAHGAYLAAVGSGVHIDAAADGAGDAVGKFQTRQAVVAGKAGEPRHRDAGHGLDMRCIRHGKAGQRAARHDDKPAHAAVRRQNIRACAEQTHADTLLCAQAQQGLQLCKRRREGHHLGGAADAERSVRRKRLLTQQAEPGQREGKTVKQIHEISSRISKNNRAILRRNFRREANRNHFIIVYHSLPSAASPRTRRMKNGLPQILQQPMV